MGISEFAESLAIVGPILALMVLGLAIALRSGVANLATPDGLRQAVGNLSHAVAMLGASLVVLLILQGLAGFRLGFLG